MLFIVALGLGFAACVTSRGGRQPALSRARAPGVPGRHAAIVIYIHTYNIILRTPLYFATVRPIFLPFYSHSTSPGRLLSMHAMLNCYPYKNR